MKKKRAQSVLEYGMLIAAVAAAFGAMSLYVKRSAQSNLKIIEGQVNAEANAK